MGGGAHALAAERRMATAELRHERHLATVLRHDQHAAAHRAHARGPGTIYVATRGGKGGAAGKNPRHPLGNLTLALKRAKPGSTIVLAPGVYTQGAGLFGKSNVTLIGASDGSSILAPSGGQALKVYSSTGITIKNLWFRTGGSGGTGLAVVGSSVTVDNIRTDGTSGYGVIVTGYGGQPGNLVATNSHFDAVQTGNGLDARDGSVVNVSNSTFNNNGTAGGSVPGGSGMLVMGNGQATITDSQFVGNLNANLVGKDTAQVTASGSTFANSHQGDGALFDNQVAVNFNGDTFASNGTVVGYGPGFNGVEFFIHYTGAAVLSGNTFRNNTAYGIYVGSASQAIQVKNNLFDGNLVGLELDSVLAPTAAVVQGNTFKETTALGASEQGLTAVGPGATGTIGGAGPLANIFEDYGYQASIWQIDINGSQKIGCPNVNILANSYLEGGHAVDASQAVDPC